ncbi:13407_t:CDS:2 [Cetraspora pellucida]|uniref:13407_t:CDS:1 n=1 Tax=Cetraspora pellucida TaxID=1433469 RepID=A0ACA9KIP7_9GLOM|nr:13407_t:CDS:2 [Cetraspora pellucida]
MSVNKNSESLLNAIPTCNTSSFPEKDFLNIDQIYEGNSEGLDEHSSKRYKNVHPFWSYFTVSEDEKWIYCKLCKPPKGKYERGSGISTIKRHFESNHKKIYDQCQQPQAVMHYGVNDTTSVPSEEAFSVAKHTLSPVRNRLDDEKACASLCLKTWYDSGLAKTDFKFF